MTGREAIVSPIRFRLFFGRERDTLRRTGLFIGSLVAVYSVSVVLLLFLDTLGFDRLFASQAATDLGMYAG